MTKENTYPLVSIAIPTYNRADKYLRQALASALEQTYPHIEIIVSNNCSTDNTDELVKSYDDKRIRYFRQEENIGLINNVNFCLREAKGAYFMQLHDDDLIDPDFIESCMKAAQYSPELGLIRTGTRVIDADNNLLQDELNDSAGLSTVDFFRSWFQWKTSLYLCSTLYNTKRLIETGGFEQSFFDDVIAVVNLAQFGRADIKDVKASFRKHPEEMTFSTEIEECCRDSLHVINLMCKQVNSEDKNAFRMEAMRFFSILNYGFTRNMESSLNKTLSYLKVFQMFDFRHFPPAVLKIVYNNPVTNTLRRIKQLSDS